MNSLVCGLVGCLAVCLGLVACAPSSSQQSTASRPSKEEMLFLAKLLGPLRDLSDKADALQTIVAKAAEGQDILSLPELTKRQGAWDMDYGWGGGRFGKRNNNGAKRYDMYGISGRFGRDTRRVQETMNNDRQ